MTKKRRRANHEGSLYYEKSRARWVAAITVGRTPEGRQKRKKVSGKTRREAQTKMKAIREALERGQQAPNDKITFGQYAQTWLEDIMPTQGLAQRTERFYEQILGGYVLPAIGEMKLNGHGSLQPEDVERMTYQLERNGYSLRTQQAARTVAGKVLRSAERQGVVTRNVVRIADPPKGRGRPKQVRALTPEQVQELLGNLHSEWRILALTGVTTGLRPSELLGLRWQDLVLDAQPSVSVVHSLTWMPGGVYELKAPKRQKSVRRVPLLPEVASDLRQWRKRQAQWRLAAGSLWADELGGLVFTDESGRPRRLDTYRKKLGLALEGATPNMLRHSYATSLLEQGAPIRHVSELLGNSSQIVEEHYSHILSPKTGAAELARGLIS